MLRYQVFYQLVLSLLKNENDSSSLSILSTLGSFSCWLDKQDLPLDNNPDQDLRLLYRDIYSFVKSSSHFSLLHKT